MARISENQIADLLEEDSYSEREIDSDDDVDNLIISSDLESDQGSIESSNQSSLVSSFQIAAHYLGKDKKTIWNKNPPPRNRRRLRSNIISHLPGVKTIAKTAKTVFEVWNLFFDSQILDEIVRCTNVFIEKRLRPNYDRDRDAKTTDLIEIKAIFGILYMCAVTKSDKVDTDDLWRDDGTTGLEFCRAVMNRNRFNFLVTALRFDDINDR